MCWVSLWIKENSRIAINDFLILGQHESATPSVYENDCISGSRTEFSFYWELFESLLGTSSLRILFFFFLGIIWILVDNVQNQKTIQIWDTLSKKIEIEISSPQISWAEWCMSRFSFCFCKPQGFPKQGWLSLLPPRYPKKCLFKYCSIPTSTFIIYRFKKMTSLLFFWIF